MTCLMGEVSPGPDGMTLSSGTGGGASNGLLARTWDVYDRNVVLDGTGIRDSVPRIPAGQ